MLARTWGCTAGVAREERKSTAWAATLLAAEGPEAAAETRRSGAASRGGRGRKKPATGEGAEIGPDEAVQGPSAAKAEQSGPSASPWRAAAERKSQRSAHRRTPDLRRARCRHPARATDLGRRRRAARRHPRRTTGSQRSTSATRRRSIAEYLPGGRRQRPSQDGRRRSSRSASKDGYASTRSAPLEAQGRAEDPGPDQRAVRPCSSRQSRTPCSRRALA